MSWIRSAHWIGCNVGLLGETEHIARYCKPREVDEGRPLAAAFLRSQRSDGTVDEDLSVYKLLAGKSATEQIDALHQFLRISVSGDLEMSQRGRLGRLMTGDIMRCVLEHTKKGALIQHTPRGREDADPHSSIYGLPHPADPLANMIATILARMAEPFPAPDTAKRKGRQRNPGVTP
jgi:hypothetical protein